MKLWYASMSLALMSPRQDETIKRLTMKATKSAHNLLTLLTILCALFTFALIFVMFKTLAGLTGGVLLTCFIAFLLFLVLDQSK